jgi:ABC-2 type transport system ATP-binding protein
VTAPASPPSSSSAGSVIEVRDLRKTYVAPLSLKRVQALSGVSFVVRPGEIFGFLGPNGAGKTTTIRILMGLIKKSSGEASIFGHPVPSRQARARLGFLPEQPYFYDYLTVAELCDFAGRLCGVDRATRRRRADELINRVGLDRARNQPLKKYSKGMMQRAGIAQALMNDPDLVVFDEPMSGLDPIGRKEVRDIILELRKQGKTVFFSSHILSDVETISDRVAIVVKGRVELVGSPSELVAGTQIATEVTLWLGSTDAAAVERLAAAGAVVRRGDRDLTVSLPATADVDDYLKLAHQLGARVGAVMPRQETLEDLFIRRAKGDAGAGGEDDAAPDPAPGAEPVRQPDEAAASREARS